MNYYQIEACKNIVCMASFEEVIHVFSLEDFNFIKEIKTNFYFGGERICISPNEDLIFTSDFENSIKGYDIKTGTLVFENEDLEEIQKIKFVPPNLYALTDNNNFYTINVTTNRILEKKEGIKDFILSEDSLYFIKNDKIFNLNGFTKTINDNLSFFSVHDKTLFLANWYEPLTKVNQTTNETLWTSDIEKGFTVQKIKPFKDIISVIANYITPARTEFHLFSLDSIDGKVLKQSMLDIKYHAFSFSKDGQMLICSNGDIIDVFEHKNTNSLKSSL